MDNEREILVQKITLLKELDARKKQALNTYIPSDNPKRNQLAFHQSTARFRLGKGGNQSGKSLMAAAECAWFLLGRHPYRTLRHGSQEIYALSAEYRTLYIGLWRHLRPDGKNYTGMAFIPQSRVHRILPKIPGHEIPHGIEVYSDQRDEKGNPLINRLTFISAEGGESARQRLQGAAIDLIAVDEEIDHALMSELRVRLLNTDGCMILSMTVIRGETYTDEIEDAYLRGDDSCFVCTLDTDFNEHIKQKTKDDVFKNMSDEEKSIRLHGKTPRNIGIIYKIEKEHVIPPFVIPENWEIRCAIDPGARVFAALWMAIDPDKELLYLIGEMYLKYPLLSDVGSFIHQFEGYSWELNKRKVPSTPLCQYLTKPVDILHHIDPAAFQSQQTGELTLGDQLNSIYDITCISARNEKQSGIEAGRQLLRPTIYGPRLKIFNCCENFLKESKSYKVAPDRSGIFAHERKQEPLKKKDHLMDCYRYLAMTVIHDFTIKQDKKPNQWKERFFNRKKDAVHPILGSNF